MTRPDWLAPRVRRLPRSVPLVQDETLPSYVRRLARANHSPVSDLVVHLNPTLVNARQLVEATEAAHTAKLQQLTDATGYPLNALAYALPELRSQHPAAASLVTKGRTIPRQPNTTRPACRRCVAVKGTAAPVTIWARHDQNVCVRHGLWIGPGVLQPDDQLDLAMLPEVTAAQRRHTRLIRRRGHEPVRRIARESFKIIDWWTEWRREGPRFERYERVLGPGWAVQPLNPLWHAALYPEAVTLIAVLASPHWFKLGTADPRSADAQHFYEQIRRTAIPGYQPGRRPDPLHRWLAERRDPHMSGEAEFDLQDEVSR